MTLPVANIVESRLTSNIGNRLNNCDTNQFESFKIGMPRIGHDLVHPSGRVRDINLIGRPSRVISNPGTNRGSKKRDSNVLKFHNFVPNNELTSNRADEGHCLKEEHGSKQINVCNWRKQGPIIVKSQRIFIDLIKNDHSVNNNNNNSHHNQINDINNNNNNNNDQTNSQQSILESLLAKQDGQKDDEEEEGDDNNQPMPKVNRRKPSTVRRVVRDEETGHVLGTCQAQNEPLDLSTRKRLKQTHESGLSPIGQQSIDSPTIINYPPVIIPESSDNRIPQSLLNHILPKIGIHQPVDKPLKLQVFHPGTVSPEGSTTCKMIAPRLSTSDDQPDLTYYHQHHHHFHLPQSSKHHHHKPRNTDRIVIKQKLEDAFRTNGFLVKTKEDEFVTVISQLAFSPNEICGIILGDTCAEVYNPLHNWTVPLTPFPKPPVAPSRKGRSLTGPTSKILHISDTHVDLQYTAGGDAACSEPLCCRATSKRLPLAQQSGYWGDYRNCDIPLRTLEAMLKNIQQNHQDIDYVIWTGDIPPHDIWNQTREGQLSLLRQISILINKYLGSVPIYPALGNHESVPVNSFPPPNIKGSYSVSWLYDVLAEVWSKWLPQDTLKTIRKGGYYSLNIKPGLKLISMNMNYCNNQNWWLLLNSTDPADELTWLINELQMSELKGEKVHIIGHIPPGSNDCLQVWSRNYYRIVNRFEGTITAQFFGHTHQDEFLVFYDTDDLTANKSMFTVRPTSIAYVGPSVTTFGGVNPGYRIYQMSTNETKWPYTVVNHETYFLNLTQANSWAGRNVVRSAFNWQFSYSPLQDYGMANLDPISWHQLVLDMVTDEKLFQRFYRNYFNKSDAKYKNCSNDVCKMDLLCRLISAHSHDPSICNKLLAEFNKSLL